MTAPLSYTSKFGYYSLRENPTFEQAIGTIRKPLGIPLPERSAKWYALSPYRALILNAAEKFNDREAAALDYKASGAELPEAAAQVRHSPAAQDPTFDMYDREHEAREARDAYETAFDLMNNEHRSQTLVMHHEHLGRTYGPNHMNPVVEASHDELVEAEVPHYMPAPRLTPARATWRTPAAQFAAAGQPQEREFPDFRTLNMGDPSSVRAATLTPAQNSTYERMREFSVGPTWSS